MGRISSACVIAAYVTFLCTASRAQVTSGWVYTKSFSAGTFTLVGSNRKIYKVHCHRVVYASGKSRTGTTVCLNTLSSVGDCTPAVGKDTDTLSFDGNAGEMIYRGALSTEYMRLYSVLPANEGEFHAAKGVCSKEKWYHCD